jgi:hypothetical protein
MAYFDERLGTCCSMGLLEQIMPHIIHPYFGYTPNFAEASTTVVIGKIFR